MVSVVHIGRRRAALVALLVSAALALSFALSPVRASTLTLTVGATTVATGQSSSIPIVLSEAPSGMAGYDFVVTLSVKDVEVVA